MIKGMRAVKKLRQEVLPEHFVTFKLRRASAVRCFPSQAHSAL